jgi:hypothetical protein
MASTKKPFDFMSVFPPDRSPIAIEFRNRIPPFTGKVPTEYTKFIFRPEDAAIDTIAIMEQTAWARVPRKHLRDRLGRPI